MCKGFDTAYSLKETLWWCDVGKSICVDWNGVESVACRGRANGASSKAGGHPKSEII